MSETQDEAGDLNLLQVDPKREGEDVLVMSDEGSIGKPREYRGVVDEDGIVRRVENGAAFNEYAYQLKYE